MMFRIRVVVGVDNRIREESDEYPRHRDRIQYLTGSSGNDKV